MHAALGLSALVFRFGRCHRHDGERRRTVVEHLPGAFNKLADLVSLPQAESSVAREIAHRLFGAAQQRRDLLDLEFAVDPKHMCGGRPNTSDRAGLRSGLEYLVGTSESVARTARAWSGAGFQVSLTRCSVYPPFGSLPESRKQPGGLCNESGPQHGHWRTAGAVTYAPVCGNRD